VNPYTVSGSMPDLVLGGDFDVDVYTKSGRWLPGISTDQYAATLAQWFGLLPQYVDGVFPNLRNFQDRRLDFLRA
jgi:hypothetical protein